MVSVAVCLPADFEPTARSSVGLGSRGRRCRVRTDAGRPGLPPRVAVGLAGSSGPYVRGGGSLAGDGTYHLPLTTYHLPLTTYHPPPPDSARRGRSLARDGTYHVPLTTYHCRETAFERFRLRLRDMQRARSL